MTQNKEAPAYFYVPTMIIEIFHGIRFGRVDFAGTTSTKEHAINLCHMLNKKEPRAFAAHVTGKVVKELQTISDQLIIENMKFFPNGIAIVPDMFTVNNYVINEIHI